MVEYKNSWIADKMRNIVEGISELENGDAYIVNGQRKTSDRAAEIVFQKKRVALLEEADKMTKAALAKKVKTMRDKLSDAAQMILNVGPYDDLSRKEFESVCQVEMLMAAHQFHACAKDK